MLIRSAPSACVIPASTPGRSGTWTRAAAARRGRGRRSASIAAAIPAASPIQRARKPASPRSSAASSCSTRRRCSASASRSALGVLEEDVDPDPRVRAGDAGHVAQRARPRRRAARGPRRGLAPAWLTSRFASACGRWLVSATSRSCASGRRRPASRRARRRSRGRGGSARGRWRRAASGTRSRPRRARRARAPARAPRSRRPDGRRRSADRRAAAQTRALVEPTSVTVRLRRSPRAPPRRARAARHRRGDDRELGARERLARASRRARRPRARRRAASASRVGVEPEHATRPRPRERRAPTEAPISPVPMIARRVTARQYRPCPRQRPQARISSAMPNARSSDWRAFSRGSQSVS